MFSLCLKAEEMKHTFWLCYYFFLKKILEKNLSSRKISLFKIKVFLRLFHNTGMPIALGNNSEVPGFTISTVSV